MTIAEAFRAWLQKHAPDLLPTDALGQAVRYYLRHFEDLTRFIECADIPIDNNRTERTLRAQAIGRRNWMFLGSDNGGTTAAVLYTLVASAKRHHLDVEAYLTDVLSRLPAVTNPHVPVQHEAPRFVWKQWLN